MTPFTVYDSIGRILRSGMCQQECLDLQAGKGEFVIALQSSDDVEWISGKEVMKRPSIDLTASSSEVAADGTSEVTISGAPVGARILVTGPVQLEGEADGDPIHLTFSIPGAYQVTVSLFPNLDAKVSIHAT